jgi:riboflavin synthase
MLEQTQAEKRHPPELVRVPEEGGETCILYGLVGGKEKSKMPKQKVTLGQTLYEPQSGTNNDINDIFVDSSKAETREATVAG